MLIASILEVPPEKAILLEAFEVSTTLSLVLSFYVACFRVTKHTHFWWTIGWCFQVIQQAKAWK